jgi:hypothetical protein
VARLLLFAVAWRKKDLTKYFTIPIVATIRKSVVFPAFV